MSGGLLQGMYSGTRGLDLGPTKMRNDEAFRRKQLMEDMRRALAGEKLQASELALRQGSMDQQRDIEMKRQALEEKLQSQRIGAQQQEGLAARAFAGQESNLDRGARERVLQMQQAFGAGESEKDRGFQTQQREIDRKMSAEQFSQKLALEDGQFAKRFALEQQAEGRTALFQKRAQELQERGVALQEASMQMQKEGMPDPSVVRKLEMLKVEYQELQNLAAKYGIQRGSLEDEAALAGIEGARARTEGQTIENEAMRGALEAKKAGPAAAPKPATQFANLPKSEANDAKRVDRLLAEGKASDVQKAMAKAYAKLADLAKDDDEDAKDRADKLRTFIKEAKKNEDYDFASPWWSSPWTILGNMLPTDSDLEDQAEALGLWDKGQ